MKWLLYCPLVSGLLLARASYAQAVDTLTTATAEPDSAVLVKGFGLAHITEPDQRTHWVYVPAEEAKGFVRTLPFYRRKEEVRRMGQPWSISLDKVQAMRVRGVYYEHLKVRGKDTHVLAPRVAVGPVELFSHVEETQLITPGGMGAGGTVVPGPPNQHWYVRRGGEVQKVPRLEFVDQMSAYFKDDPATVAAITQHELHYRDMLAIVQAYNQRRLAAGTNKQ